MISYQSQITSCFTSLSFIKPSSRKIYRFILTKFNETKSSVIEKIITEKMSKFLIFLALVAVCQASLPHIMVPKMENTLAHYILKSSQSLENSPKSTTNCFLEYLPKLNQLTEEYEAAYTNCLTLAANSRERVEAEVLADRTKVQELGSAICEAYSKCSDITSSADYFDCYFTAVSSFIIPV